MDSKKTITSLCKLSKKYQNSKTAFTSSNGEGIYVIQFLEQLAFIITKKLSKDLEGLEVKISKGQGKVPRIFWVSIIPNGQSPSESLSLTTCFGRTGEGLVSGLMIPKLGVLHDQETKKRSGEIIDVDGDKEAVRYNNCFVNPLEILIEEFVEVIYLNHLALSISLLREKIREGKNAYLKLRARL